MSKIFKCATIFLLVFSFLIGPSLSALDTNNFVINSFDTNYYLQKSNKNVASMRVVEKIVATYPDYDQNHGIIRAIPNEYKDNDLNIKIQAVVNEQGRPYQYSTSESNNNTVLKIGDPNTYVHGKTTYIISYLVSNFITFEGSHDEFYWDVNGDEWAQPIDKVSATIHVPKSVGKLKETLKKCYEGAYGEQDSNCKIKISNSDNMQTVKVSASKLNPYQTLTFVLGFEKGTFQPDKLALIYKRIFMLLIIASALLPIFITLLVVILKWRKRGRDPKGRGVIVPQYIAPKDLDVILADVILNERLTTNAISAGIIELAISKFIIIHEIKKDKLIGSKTEYELELIKKEYPHSAQLKEIIVMLFGSTSSIGDKVNMSEKKNAYYKDVQSLGKSTTSKASSEGYFAVDPSKAKTSFNTVAILMLVIGILVMFTGIGIPLGIGLIVSSILTFIASNAMPARTIKGVEVRDCLLGLKEYIKLAEAERLKYLQSPKGVKQYGNPKSTKSKVKLFEKLLPYAMLFGLEKDWAKEFEDIYNQPPDWYQGNYRNFNAAYLASSLNSFSANSTSSFSPPSSSGSSGFSSGGGFSGGGGGGGGGGGW